MRIIPFIITLAILFSFSALAEEAGPGSVVKPDSTDQSIRYAILIRGFGVDNVHGLTNINMGFGISAPMSEYWRFRGIIRAPIYFTSGFSPEYTLDISFPSLFLKKYIYFASFGPVINAMYYSKTFNPKNYSQPESELQSYLVGVKVSMGGGKYNFSGGKLGVLIDVNWGGKEMYFGGKKIQSFDTTQISASFEIGYFL